MDAFKEIVEQKIEPKLLNIFHNKPSSKLEIVEVTLHYIYCTVLLMWVRGSVDFCAVLLPENLRTCFEPSV